MESSGAGPKVESFTIDTSMYGLFVVREDHIIRFFLTDEQRSSGLLVKDHYKDAEGALFCAWLMREGRCYESVAAYAHTEADLEDAPRLDKVVDALERMLDALTDKVYGQRAATGRFPDEFRFTMELDYIANSIIDLHEGRYYENEDMRYGGRRGIPRIETIGRRLLDAIMDLVWRMDGGAASMCEEMREKTRDIDERVFGSIKFKERP